MGEPSGSGASSAAIPMDEADLGDESYGGAEGDDNGDFGAGDEFEGFDQYGDGNEFDDSMGAAGGSGAAADGKGQFVVDAVPFVQTVESKYEEILNSDYRLGTDPELTCRYCKTYMARTKNALSQHISRHHR